MFTNEAILYKYVAIYQKNIRSNLVLFLHVVFKLENYQISNKRNTAITYYTTID
jgi:hypothetical protein